MKKQKNMMMSLIAGCAVMVMAGCTPPQGDARGYATASATSVMLDIDNSFGNFSTSSSAGTLSN